VTRHVDAEELARFREGDLGRWRSWRVRSHLSRCARCRELDAELAEIPALLASVEEPPLPEHVTAMIQGALAREASLRAAATQAAGTEQAAARPASAASDTAGPDTTGPDKAAPAGTRAGGRGAGRRQRNWRLPTAGWPVALRAAAAAAAVAVLAVSGLEIAQHSGSSSPSASSGSHAPAAAPFSNAQATENGPALSYTHNGRQYRITAISTHIDFTPGKLNGQVSQLVRSRSSTVPKPATNTSPASAAGIGGASATFGNFSVSSLNGCVNRVAAGALVILVDVDHFQDSPATVIVTQVSALSPLEIWVVGIGCTASSSDTLTHTLLTRGS
jgi:hypothetical protein